jgi:hypothetical protein
MEYKMVRLVNIMWSNEIELDNKSIASNTYTFFCGKNVWNLLFSNFEMYCFHHLVQ